MSAFRARWLIVLSLLLLAGAGRVAAHALAPSLLSLEPTGDGRYEVAWKTPLQKVAGSDFRPVMPNACNAVTEPQLSREGTGLVRRWRVDCGAEGLTGKTLAVEGIASSKADVLLRIGVGGSSLQQVLTAESPSFTVPAEQGWAQIFHQYLVLGTEHLLFGLDHVLFVVALVLLVSAARPLIITITSFTLGHSVTLSAAVLGYVNFPQSLAEIAIAFSIIIAIAGSARNDPTLMIRRWPWIIAFGFGLLHGLGFAGALAEVGLPPADIPMALLAFNVGIEIGQLLLIAGLLVLYAGLRRLPKPGPIWRSVPLYAVGTLAGFWFWQRLLG